MRSIQYKSKFYQFKPTLLGWIITLICIPLFIKFGLWQYNKAQQKLDIQSAYQQAESDQALSFPLDILSTKSEKIERWKYKRVAVTGEYQMQYQFLLDNQVEGTQAGYHVITPLKIKDSAQYVLVNRGWIPAKNAHAELPVFSTPTGQQLIIGQVWVPSNKFYTLEKLDQLNELKFQHVWQNLDLERYKKQVPITVSALLIKLDKASDAGGFVRNWQVPVARISTHIGYAYQWFGFAIATFLIFIYMSFNEVITSKPDEY